VNKNGDFGTFYTLNVLTPTLSVRIETISSVL
jgi:hypothetical protein